MRLAFTLVEILLVLAVLGLLTALLLYLPNWANWAKARELEWYASAPHFGSGKWDDLTPLAGCMWHWAKWFDPDASGNTATARGWHLYLTCGGSVRKVRIEEPIDGFSPDKYN